MCPDMLVEFGMWVPLKPIGEKAILNINPEAQVYTFNSNILMDKSVLDRTIKISDLVLGCADSEKANYTINAYDIRLFQEEGINVPVIYAGAFERAFGGDIVRVIPGETPCYDCVLGRLQDFSFEESKPRGKIAYSFLDSSSDYKPEPGLGIDINFIALIQAKMGLLTLLKGSESKLEDISHNYIFWGNRKEWIFTRPFQALFANLEKRDNCPTCGTGQNLMDEFNLDPNNINEDTDNLITSLPKSDLDITTLYSNNTKKETD